MQIAMSGDLAIKAEDVMLDGRSRQSLGGGSSGSRTLLFGILFLAVVITICLVANWLGKQQTARQAKPASRAESVASYLARLSQPPESFGPVLLPVGEELTLTVPNRWDKKGAFIAFYYVRSTQETDSILGTFGLIDVTRLASDHVTVVSDVERPESWDGRFIEELLKSLGMIPPSDTRPYQKSLRQTGPVRA